jgi:signal transduction histidine kinase
VIGIIWTACRTEHRLTDEDARFLDTVGAQAGIALENATAWTKMQELDEKKTQFVNIITHELRSPVAVTQSLLDTLAGGYAGEVPEKQRELLERARQRLRTLEKLVNDLLALARAKALPGEHEEEERTSLAEVAVKVVGRHQVVAEQKELTLRLQREGESCCVVKGALDKLDRILDNLVSNAVKYTPPGGRVEVTVESEGDQRVVRVADTGIGIPQASIARLGKEFFRAPNARRLEPVGTGLGLAITRDLLASLGGRLEIESEEGRGSTFTLHLPAG